MKVGLFFGSFNPIHLGHLAIASCMIENGGIDNLWFVVSPQNPLKKKDDLLADNLRLEMVKLAIESNSRFIACDTEISLPLPSYTINTLNYLRTKFPDNEFQLIMGADNFVNLNKWKDYEKLIAEYRFLVYPRPGFNLQTINLKENFKLIDAPLLNISSTFIRESIAKNLDVSQFLPSNVFRYIVDKQLYK